MREFEKIAAQIERESVMFAARPVSAKPATTITMEQDGGLLQKAQGGSN